MSRCVAFLDALNALTPDDWRHRAASFRAESSRARAAVRAQLERRCDAFELWALRDEVDTLCWRLQPAERRWLREMIADAAIAVLAGVPLEDEAARPVLAPFADLVPR